MKGADIVLPNCDRDLGDGDGDGAGCGGPLIAGEVGVEGRSCGAIRVADE